MTTVEREYLTGGPLAEPPPAGRRRVDPAVPRRFRLTMRNDFLTPRGTPYKWQELRATVSRTVTGGRVPTVVPVRYQWQRLAARTGDRSKARDWREWTFARGQGFDAVLLHTELAGALGDGAASTAETSQAFTIAYPELLQAPAVDLLLMLSWDVVTFEMLAGHLLTTPALRQLGGRAELERLGGSWGELQFSALGGVAMFRNAQTTAQFLGYGRAHGRTSAVYSSQCLDCELETRSGPVTQQGRSSYWSTVQLDTETGDLLAGELTELIVATLTTADGRQLPVPKRRLVRMDLDLGAEPVEPALPRAAAQPARTRSRPTPIAPADATTEPATAAPAAAPTTTPADRATATPTAADPTTAQAIRLAGRVADHVRWLTARLEHFPPAVAEFALMGFQSMVGADPAAAYRRVRQLRADLAAPGDDPDPEAPARLQARLPEYRSLLEGLLAFGEAAMDETARDRLPEVPGAWEYQDEPTQRAVSNHMRTVFGDITGLLRLVERLEGTG
ncbi:MAG TPA: hypothetical protein VIL37_11730 [Natronosporangium sp.]